MRSSLGGRRLLGRDDRLLVRQRLVLLSLDQLDRVVDQVGGEVLQLLLGEIDVLEGLRDLVVGQEPLLLALLDELVQLLDVWKGGVDGEHGPLFLPGGGQRQTLERATSRTSLPRLRPFRRRIVYLLRRFSKGADSRFSMTRPAAVRGGSRDAKDADRLAVAVRHVVPAEVAGVDAEQRRERGRPPAGSPGTRRRRPSARARGRRPRPRRRAPPPHPSRPSRRRPRSAARRAATGPRSRSGWARIARDDTLAAVERARAGRRLRPSARAAARRSARRTRRRPSASTRRRPRPRAATSRSTACWHGWPSEPVARRSASPSARQSARKPGVLARAVVLDPRRLGPALEVVLRRGRVARGCGARPRAAPASRDATRRASASCSSSRSGRARTTGQRLERLRRGAEDT